MAFRANFSKTEDHDCQKQNRNNLSDVEPSPRCPREKPQPNFNQAEENNRTDNQFFGR